jgi:hypothetical protein
MCFLWLNVVDEPRNKNTSQGRKHKEKHDTAKARVDTLK